MKLKVIGKSHIGFCMFDCVDEGGKSHRVDLTVNADFPDDTPDEYFIGKTFEVDELHPFTEIAMNVREVK